MKLSSIIQKSRILVDKLFQKSNVKFTKEDYFMISVSLFIAKKESIIKKDNTTNTLYFDYKKNKQDYYRMLAFDEILSKHYIAFVDIPTLGKYNLAEQGCFDGIENVVFPFNQKIVIENFDGTLNELNEIKRKIWIYSKIRDSFVHGDKFVFDTYNNKIVLFNSLTSETIGAFNVEMIISPEILNMLSGIKYEQDNVFYGYMNEETYKRYIEIYEKLSSRQIQELESDSISELYKEIDEISNVDELLSILNVIKEYKKAYPKMTIKQREEYSDKIIKIIVSYSGRNKANNQKSKEIFEYLSDVLNVEDDLYHLALYSHMVFVFANLENINSDNLKTKGLRIENDIYAKVIKKLVVNANNAMSHLLNKNINPEKTRDSIVEYLMRIQEIMKIRNRWVLNNLRNGIEHKNVNIEDDIIEIYNRKDNRTEQNISFKCTSTMEIIDEFLLNLETSEKSNEELNTNEFIDEIISICSDGKNTRTFIKYLKAFEEYIDSKREEPHMF